MKEKLELVTDFATLRAGMIVVSKNCSACGEKHRAMLIRLVAVDIPGEGPHGWTQVPRTDRCQTGKVKNTVTTPQCRALLDHRLYCVVDDLESTAETKQRKSVTA